MNFTFHLPTKILFGAGSLSKLSSEKLPGKKALIVISSGKSIKTNGYLARLEKQLDLANVDYMIYDKIVPNPISRHVDEAAQIAHEANCDFVIGLGGGSSIDASKAIAIAAANPGSIWDYVKNGSGKGKEIENHPLPIVAITTTAGTGTEADPWMVITNEETNEKTGFGFSSTFPVLSIVDPELMCSVPPAFTAYQGFDALFHSTEGFIHKDANEMSDMFALKAITLVGENLPQAVKNGDNLHAREKVALANTLSGIVEWVSGCTSEHSLEHALSAFYPNLPHGAGLIMLSKSYYTFFAKKHVCDDRLIAMAKALGIEDAADPMDFIKALDHLQEECQVSHLKMSDYGIKEQDFAKFAENAMATNESGFEVDRCTLTKEDCISIYQHAFN